MRNKARFILSRSIVKKQYDDVCSMADIVSYSFKTNFEVGHVLEQDTDSLFSIHSIESAGMLKDMSRVIFLAQAWDRQELEQAFAMGIRKFIVDNTADMDRLMDFLEGTDYKIWLFVRIRLKEHTVHTGKYFVYGMRRDVAMEQVNRLHSHENIEKLGIHFHRKTQNMSEWNIKEELEGMFPDNIFRQLSFVNIGGGLPAEYKNFRKEAMQGIRQKILELKEWLNSKGVKLMIEPGRYIAAPSIVLEAKVMNVYEDKIIVNCSVWNAAMDTFIQHIRLLIEGEQESGKTYTIKGNSPDSMDILRYRVYLKDVKAGDTIRFLNAGAYNFHCNFCNLPKLVTDTVD